MIGMRIVGPARSRVIPDRSLPHSPGLGLPDRAPAPENLGGSNGQDESPTVEQLLNVAGCPQEL